MQHCIRMKEKHEGSVMKFSICGTHEWSISLGPTPARPVHCPLQQIQCTNMGSPRVIADLKSSSCVDRCELACEWRILVAPRRLDGSCLHLTHNSNL